MRNVTRRVLVAAAVAGAVLGGALPAYAAPADTHGVYAVQQKLPDFWTGSTPLLGPDGHALSSDSVSATSLPDGSVQVVAADPACGLCYQNRLVDGTWTGWQTLDGPDGAETFAAHQVAIAGLADGSAVVLATDADNVLYHRIQDPGGNWSDWTAVPGYNGAPTIQVTSAAVTGLPDGSYVMAVAASGAGVLDQPATLEDGFTWWREEPGPVPDVPVNADTVAVSGQPDGTTQLIATDRTARHAVYRMTLGDYRSWQQLPGRDGAKTFSGSAVGITTMPDGSVAYLATDATSHLTYEAVRDADGNLGAWELVPGPVADGAPTPFRSVAFTAEADGTRQFVEAI